MLMEASTYFFVAGPEEPCVESVWRLTVTPPMVTAAEALAVKVATLVLLMVRVQVRVLPEPDGAEQVLLCDDGVGLTLGTMAPKLTGVTDPGSAVTTMVKTWAWLTS